MCMVSDFEKISEQHVNKNFARFSIVLYTFTKIFVVDENSWQLMCEKK